MKLYQQTPNCSDFDVTITGSEKPSFRILLPEWIRGVGLQHQGLCHVIPGIWHEKERGMHGAYSVNEQLQVEVEIEARDTEILAKLEVRNCGGSHIQDMWLNVCTAVNHLPGDPGWSNSDFLPSLPLDRTIQGRYWYEHVTPHRLFALTSSGLIPMHPHPDNPDASNVPLYSFVSSKDADALACAVQSVGGKTYCFQAWSNLSRYCTPCPGNACMHLEPFLAKTLFPNDSASIYGLAGIHQGDSASLSTRITEFFRQQ
jgi:hypothetical protein